MLDVIPQIVFQARPVGSACFSRIHDPLSSSVDLRYNGESNVSMHIKRLLSPVMSVLTCNFS